jgi:hypothetical protein
MTKRSSPPVLSSAPTDLVAVAVGGFQVILAWTECGACGLGFRIERAAGNSPSSPFVEIGGVGPHVTAFNDVSVKAGMTYSYRVHARNDSGDSSPSNVVELTTP